MKQETMGPTRVPNKNHEDIPGNPSTATSSKVKLRTNLDDGKGLKVLSEADWEFWITNGYVIVRNAVSLEQTEATANFLWEFEEKDPTNPETWYTAPRAEMQMKELTNTGMVEVYNHQMLWNNRQSPKIHAAFADIWGTEKLWCTIDRANLNFPLRPGFEYKAFIHWDYDLRPNPKTYRVSWPLRIKMTKTWVDFSASPNYSKPMIPGSSPNPWTVIGSNRTPRVLH